jgi:hypothetical protein
MEGFKGDLGFLLRRGLRGTWVPFGTLIHLFLKV